MVFFGLRSDCLHLCSWLHFMASITQFALNCVTVVVVVVVVAVAIASVVIKSIELFSTNEGQSKYSVAKCGRFRTFHDIEIKMRRLSMFHLCVCGSKRERNKNRKKQITNGRNKKTFVFQCAEFGYGLASTLNMYVAYIRFTQFARTFRYRSRGCALFPFLYIHVHVAFCSKTEKVGIKQCKNNTTCTLKTTSNKTSAKKTH